MIGGTGIGKGCAMERRWWVAGAVLLGVGLVAYRSRGTVEEPRERPRGEAVPVAIRDLSRTVEAVGVVEPAFVLEVKSKASGEIVSMPYEEGDRVSQGALLVELLPVDEERNVRKQRAAVLAAQAQTAKSRNAVRIAELQLTVSREQAASRLGKAVVDNEVAVAELKRQESLFKRDLVSQKELDTARRAKEQAEADLAVAESQRRAVQLDELRIEESRQEALLRETDLERARIELEVAEIRLNETRIHAPMDGLVLERPVERGQIIASGISNVSGGTTLMTLADVSQLFLEAEVDESDVGGIRPGLEVNLSAEAYPDENFGGRVQRVAPRGIEEQNVTIFRVRIALDERAVRLLKPGMNATASIVVERRAGATVVPAEAVRTRGDRVGVMVPVEGDRPRFVPVKLGLRDGKDIEVRGELHAGDKVLLPAPEGASGRGGGGRAQGDAMRQGMRAARRMGGS